MAKRRKKAKTTKKSKGHVPLKILEKRLTKLARLVKSRGGQPR